MRSRTQETIVVSVGGSLVVPNEINSPFLKELNTFIRENIKKNKRFLISVGGGNTARLYINGAKQVIDTVTNDDLDWLGIHSTRLNAHLLRTILRDIAHPRIIDNYDEEFENVSEPVILAGGWKPGWSTDYCAVLLARNFNAKLVVNLSNIYYVYNKDPNKFSDAIKIEKTTWDYYEKLVGNKWTPGMSSPFDPIATQMAKKLGLTVVVTKGDDFNNLQRLVDGESFKGTVIMPSLVTAEYFDREYYLGEKGEYPLKRNMSLISQMTSKVASWYRAVYIAQLYKPKSFLDIGCGTGKTVRSLRKMGVDAHGLEVSKDAISLSKPDIRPYLHKGDITKLPFKDNEFEMVGTFNVLEHVERSKMRKAIEETIRISSRYILHKVYTPNNKLHDVIHGHDMSRLSIYDEGFWYSLFSSFPQVRVNRRRVRLPHILETVFVLEKLPSL